MSWNRSSSPGSPKAQYRTKRRLVTFNELPPNLVNAVTSIEDRRFFEHGGVDYFRLLGALRDDLRLGKRREGGSTLTMQLARGFFLTPEKKLKRKIIEIAITFQLENRFNKQQIFQLYANQIPLGQQGSFAINGFGQAAQTYFGKDVRQLDLAQCALLAGMIQHPSYLNPYRHPDRAIQRRNLVLDAMVETGKITKEEAIRAKAEPLKLAPMNIDAGEAPYFVDLVRDRLVQHLGDTDFNHEGLRIYTSLDPDLQQVASDAVAEGMKAVDAQVEKLHARRVKAGDDVAHRLSPGCTGGAQSRTPDKCWRWLGGGITAPASSIMQWPTGPPDPSSSLLSMPRLSIPAWPARYSPSPLRRLLPARSWYPPILLRPIRAGQAASLPPSPCSTMI